MKKDNILIILVTIIIILIIGIVLVVILNKKELKESLIINDINNITNTKKLDVALSNLEKNNFGYNIELTIKNNSDVDVVISSMKLSLKDEDGNQIGELYFNINDTINSNEIYSSKLTTDQDLSNVRVIDYELLD